MIFMLSLFAVIVLIIIFLIFYLDIQIYYYDHLLRYYYLKYHSSFKDNILEAQKTQNLPKDTIKYKNKYNFIRKKMLNVDPKTSWKELM